ncbi:MAG: FAD-dependent oxidoreductase [Alphaproteobacteria bacterium]
MKTVAILGGGVGGLSAAHELLERGFRVNIYERQSIPGGKARSFGYWPKDQEVMIGSTMAKVATRAEREPAEPGDGGPNPGLPGEHGFRFFPGFYRHITDIMKRTPKLTGDGNVIDDLVKTNEVGIARTDAHVLRLPTHFPRSLAQLRTLLKAVEEAKTGLSYEEFAHFSTRVWQIMTSSEARRVNDYERIGWWDFIDGDRQSDNFKRYFGNLTRSLVAAQPRLASTRTNGDILEQLIIDMMSLLSTPDRVLKGPTNEVWIHPWIQHLCATYGDKFAYYLDVTVDRIDCDETKRCITGVGIRPSNVGRPPRRIERCCRDFAHTREVELGDHVDADYYISALPVERMAKLVTPAMEKCDPVLRWLKDLELSVEWMNGIVFFLKRDVPIANGHVLYLDPPTALTSISQKQFWAKVDMERYGKGDVVATLSVDVSNWDDLVDDDRETIDDTIWQQLKQTLNGNGEEILRDDDLLYTALDPSITQLADVKKSVQAQFALETASADQKEPNGRRLKSEIIHQIGVKTENAAEPLLDNAEPLLVNTTDSWRCRPYADSRIKNLFLASDYVRTSTDLATMEAANEAARRAVNAILDYEGSSAKRVRVWALRKMWILAPFRWLDRRRFDQGRPWQDPLPWLPNIVPPVWRFLCWITGVRKTERSASDTAEISALPKV